MHSFHLPLVVRRLNSERPRWRLHALHTSTADMREDHAHRTAVQDPLHEAIAALIRHPHERRDPGQQARRAQLARFVDRERRVLEVDEQRIKAGLLRDLHRRRLRGEFDAECLCERVDQQGIAQQQDVVYCARGE